MNTLSPGDRVNLERAVTPVTRLGGHFVLGHVDGIGRITVLQKKDKALLVEITAPPEMAHWFHSKGSIAVDGVSLTLDATPTSGRIQLNLIPHTLETPLSGEKSLGDAVNLEADFLAKGAIDRKDQSQTAVSNNSHGERSGLSVNDILGKGFRRSR